MADPTREEMLTALENSPLGAECSDFDREAAIYWFASDYHGGQWSNLYSALSRSPYTPGRCMNSVQDEDETVCYLYEELELNF